MSHPAADQNLLFAVLALQTYLIDKDQFAEICAAWAARKEVPIGILLLEHGWLKPEEKQEVDRLLERMLKKHGGDVRQSLGAAAGSEVRDIIRTLGDSDIRNSISSLPAAAGYVLVETLNAPSEQRTRYSLTRLHGQGGLGKVWVARDNDLNREVALKEIRPEQAGHPEAWRRFLKEAQVTGQLEHPNIVPVYELAKRPEDNQPFYTMRLVRGRTLREAIAEHHRKPDYAVERYRLLTAFISICNAIGYAHSRGVIHRDLKPENVILGGFGEVIVLDWGLAKMVDGQEDGDLPGVAVSEQAQAQSTLAGKALGTPAYMAPEQADGRLDQIDTRTDIYGLGAILFEILTGQPPHHGPDTASVLRGIIHGDTPRARDAVRRAGRAGGDSPLSAPALNIHIAIDAVCAKAMAKRREDRYAKASDLADEVQRFLADEPVHCIPDPLPVRLARWSRKHRTVVTSATALLLTVAVALAVGNILISQEERRTEQKRQEAVVARDQAERSRKEAEEQRNEAKRQEVEAAKQRDHAKAAQVTETIARKAAETEKRRAQAQLLRAEWLLYAGQINQAQREWENNRADLAMFHLNGTRKEFRDWEYDYLYALFNRNPTTLKGHVSSVRSVAFSPDGRRIASGSFDTTLKVWDAATGHQIRTFIRHTDGISSVAFSPDGKRIVSASHDKTLNIWDAATGEHALTLKGNTAEISCVAFSPDGKRIASGSASHMLNIGTSMVWDAGTGKEILTFKGNSWSLAFSPDGKHIASAGEGFTPKVWDSATGKETVTFEGGHTHRVSAVAFSPDGKRIATASLDKTLKVWDAGTGKELLTLKAHADMVLAVSFSPDGKHIVSGGQDNNLILWDAATGKPMRILKGHTGSGVLSVAFSLDGKYIVSGGADMTVKIWDAASDKETRTLKGHRNVLPTVFILGDWQIVSSNDETLKVWGVADGNLPFTLKGHKFSAHSVAFSPDGKHIVKGGNGPLQIWDAATGKETRTLKGHSGVISVGFSPDGKRIVSSRVTLKVWDANTGKETLTLKGHTDFVNSVCFSPDGTRIVSASHDKTLKVWDAGTGQEILTLKGHTAEVRCLAMSRDGKQIVSGSDDKTTKVWDAVTGQEICTLNGHTDAVTSVAFSPDGKRIVSGSADKTLKVWNSTAGQEILTLNGHIGAVNCVAFSSDGKRIGSASEDGAVIVWEGSRKATE